MAQKDPRMTPQTRAVIQAFLADPAKSLAGSDVARLTGLLSGSLYPILNRLESTGWLVSEWELLDPSEIGRPRKRLYELTAYGIRNAERTLTERPVQVIGGLSWA